ncbi:Hypothetical predicted protein, partial [Xyrichtys novacula]
MRVRKEKSLNEMTDSPPPPPSLPVLKHLTLSSLGSPDRLDTCQSYNQRQGGEDSSIHSSTCCCSTAPKLTLQLIHSQTAGAGMWR